MNFDVIGDLITRIRNAAILGKRSVSSPLSRFRISVLSVLKIEGYILNYIFNSDGIFIYLKYCDGSSVISSISRVSKPGCRIYVRTRKILSCNGGLGIYVISTPIGVVSDHEARLRRVGGEVLLKVF